MGSRKGRKYHTWTGPVRSYMRCLAVHFFDRGYTGVKELATVFTRSIPNWRDHFGGTITDKALWDRADKARRNTSENPETHEEMSQYWERASRDGRTGKKWTSWQELQEELIGETQPSLAEAPLFPDLEQPTPLEDPVDIVTYDEQMYTCRPFVVSVRLLAELTRLLRQHGVSVVFDPVTREEGR